MFKLYFIVILASGQTIKEEWPDEYFTHVECRTDGWVKVKRHQLEILRKYPDIQKFDIQCLGLAL